jgi:hypothetical protein
MDVEARLVSGSSGDPSPPKYLLGHRLFPTGVQGMKRFLLVIALALGLLAVSVLPAVADEHVARRSNWSHDRTKVYTTTAVNQHNQYGDLQGILKFRQGSTRSTGNFDIQIDYVRLYRVLPDRSRLLVVGDNIDQNLLVTETWTYVNSGWQAGETVTGRSPCTCLASKSQRGAGSRGVSTPSDRPRGASLRA